MFNRIWLALIIPATVWAQDISLNMFASLESKANEKVQVNLEGSLLQMASRFMDNNDPDQAKVKALLNGLKGIYVRSFKFDKPGAYAAADVDKLRAQLKGWNEIVSVRNSKENTGIFLKSDGQKIQGLVVLAAEPLELTVVNISGTIQPDQLKDLSGKFGIPDLGDLGKKTGGPKKE